MNAGSSSLGCNSRFWSRGRSCSDRAVPFLGNILGTFLGQPGQEGQGEGKGAQVETELMFLVLSLPRLAPPSPGDTLRAKPALSLSPAGHNQGVNNTKINPHSSLGCTWSFQLLSHC